LKLIVGGNVIIGHTLGIVSVMDNINSILKKYKGPKDNETIKELSVGLNTKLVEICKRAGANKYHLHLTAATTQDKEGKLHNPTGDVDASWFSEHLEQYDFLIKMRVEIPFFGSVDRNVTYDGPGFGNCCNGKLIEGYLDNIKYRVKFLRQGLK
jgi:hypothetical protein